MTQVVLTTLGTNTWTIPSDFGSTNTIEVIGAGGNGGRNDSTPSAGGGGGGYGKKNNVSLTPGGSISYTIAVGGSGTDTFFNGASLAVAPVGSSAGVNGAGSGNNDPSVAGGTGKGDTTYSGGSSGKSSAYGASGGGGGAAGLHGNGNNGTDAVVATGGHGGSGDAGSGGTGGSIEQNGGNGTEWSSSPAYGSGGGGGGSNAGDSAVGAGGTYGGGGGGSEGGLGRNGGVGQQGLIVINYTPAQYLTLTASTGTFTLTGENATFTKTVNVSFATGHYTLTGNAVSFKFNGAYVFGVNTGYFVLTGEDAALSIGVNNKIYAGIFSLIVSPSQLGESASGLVMEAQNSYGLTPAFNSNQNGLLISNEQYENYDSYYSAWSNSNMGGIDFNDTTLWSNYEPLIETDIIPIGTYLNKKTLGSIEFKLDRPLATGDSISLYWRPSLTDAYIPIPLVDTSSSLISNYGISAINQAQWAQFLIAFACASSGSSRIPFRELRLHINE